MVGPSARLALAKMRATVAAGRPAQHRVGRSGSPGRGHASGDLDCFVVGDVTRAQLEAAGAHVRSELPGGIFTVFVPLDAVDAVVAIAGVERVEGAQIEETQLDASVPTTNATLFRGPGPAFTGLNGAGILVGNVDTGVDYHHDDFKDALGNTRFLKIWDETDPVGPPAAGFGYGSDWTAADINAPPRAPRTPSVTAPTPWGSRAATAARSPRVLRWPTPTPAWRPRRI
jgi:hypothetical protein